jgi:hypothetical protein
MEETFLPMLPNGHDVTVDELANELSNQENMLYA